MKNIKISLITLILLGNFVYAGGEFTTITPYEEEDIQLAEEVYIDEPEPVEPIEIVEERVIAPVIVAPKTFVPPEPVISTVPAKKDIKANGFYAGLGISATHYNTKCNCTPSSKSGTDNSVGVMARVGYDFNKYIGIEARGIATSWKSDGGKVEHAGLFIKPMLPIGDATNVYGLVGFAKTKTKGHLRTTNADALALGAGVEVDLTKDTPKDGRYNRAFDGKGDQEKGLGLFADYERMVVKSGAPDLDAVSAGVTYDF